MSRIATTLSQKVWNYAQVLRDDGLGYMEYLEQITYLLFLKMIWDRQETGMSARIPATYSWEKLRAIPDNLDLEKRYQQALRYFSGKDGLLGLIFAKPQSKISDPAKLRLLINMIDEEDWSAIDIDVKGEIYESLLARNAEDVRGGAGQYFTPRPVIRAIVEVMRPLPGMTIADPASGTGGFLLAAHERLKCLVKTADEKKFLQTQCLRGTDIVSNVARLCAMNLYLHDVGTDPDHPPVTIGDSLTRAPEKVDMVVTNPPFGKKSSITAVSDGRKVNKDDITYARNDFWATTSNKQLNFVQHVYTMLKDGGRAAMVVPDNVLFESGAGEKIRRELFKHADVHTLLRLPTGIWYSTGVKANVIFFDKKPSKKNELWVYDLRSNNNFTLRQNPITTEDLKDFIACYNPITREKRRESKRFKLYSHADILTSAKANLNLTWLGDDSYSDPNSLPPHDILAAEVVALLKEAVSEFEASVAVVRKAQKKRKNI